MCHAEALQAAHIKVKKGFDDNHPTNGILLRADIHALFDAGLITLTEDGTSVQVIEKDLLKDAVYGCLDGKLFSVLVLMRHRERTSVITGDASARNRGRIDHIDDVQRRRRLA